jgi:hypothetical protein
MSKLVLGTLQSCPHLIKPMMLDPIASAESQEATQNFTFRNATVSDVPALKLMISDSLRALAKNYYTQSELDGSIGYLFGPDSVLIHDQ